MIEVELPTTPKEIKAATDAVIAQIEKDHGKGSIIRMDEKVGIDMPNIPTGLITLDNDVLGIGGMPKGRIIEIYGPESSGKTTLALAVIAAVQRAGGQAAIIDAEHALDPNWASTNGVDMNKLLVSQPDYGEQALQIVEALLASGAFGVVVVDSVAALVPKSELEGEIGDSSMGVQARMMSQACRKLNGLVAKSGTILIFINQIRDKIGVMFGSPEITTGGKALKFYASVRLDVRKIGSIKEGEELVGNKVRIKAVKNKVSRPFVECEVDLMFDSGFNSTAILLDAAVSAGVVEKSGSWYSYNGERMGQGKNGAIAWISNNAGKSQELLSAVTAKKGN